MIEINATLSDWHSDALFAACVAALGFVESGGKFGGVSTYGPARPISLWLDDSASGADETTAASLTAAHDPVHLSVDKATITANGTDAATVTVRAGKPGAAAITLLVNGVTDWPIALTGGVGTDTLTALDAGTITITVKNPANRSTDQLVIEAI